jgi:hypothetical protein
MLQMAAKDDSEDASGLVGGRVCVALIGNITFPNIR